MVLATQQLHFQISIKSFFEKYLQIIYAFDRLRVNQQSPFSNNHRRRVFNHQHADFVITAGRLFIESQVRRVRFNQGQAIDLHNMNQVGAFVRRNHNRVILSQLQFLLRFPLLR